MLPGCQSPGRICARERQDSLSSCFPTSSWMSRCRVSREGASPWEGGRRVISLPMNSCSEIPAGTTHSVSACLVLSTSGLPSPLLVAQAEHPVLHVTWTRLAGPWASPPAPPCTDPGGWPQISPGEVLPAPRTGRSPARLHGLLSHVLWR